MFAIKNDFKYFYGLWVVYNTHIHSIITQSEVIILTKPNISSGLHVVEVVDNSLRSILSTGLKTHTRISWEMCYIETESNS